MAATIKDVARLAGCSIKTVSRVVNEEPHVSQPVREKVLAAIETLGYAPNISARRLVTRRAYTICILLHAAGYYQSAILSKIMEIGYEYDYDILVQTYFPAVAKSKHKLASLIAERRVDGLVTTPPSDLDDFVANLVRRSGIPLVQIAPFNRTADVPGVSGDDYQGALLMMEHLIGLGHRRIAFFKGPQNHRMSLDRFYGYLAALDAHQIPFDPALVFDSLFNFDGGYTAAKLSMRLADRPTAVFAGSDEAALGAMYAMREMGVEIPAQISIAGFDDLPQSKNVWPGLTTVHNPIDEIVERAALLLTGILNGDQPEQPQQVLPPRLVTRGSTGPVPRR